MIRGDYIQNKIVSIVLIFAYSGVFLCTLYKLKKSTSRVLNDSIKRIRIILIEILVLSVLRISSSIYNCVNQDEKVLVLLDIFSECIVDLAILSFVLYWLELFIEYDFLQSREKKRCFVLMFLGFYVIAMALDIALHVVFVGLTPWENYEIYMIGLLDAFFDLFILFNAVLAGLFVIKRIKKVFAQQFSDIITKRLSFVIVSTCSILMLRMVVCILFENLYPHYEMNVVMAYFVIFSYYIITEILPITLILIYFKPQLSLEDDDLPSMFNDQHSGMFHHLTNQSTIRHSRMIFSLLSSKSANYIKKTNTSNDMKVAKCYTQDIIMIQSQ